MRTKNVVNLMKDIYQLDKYSTKQIKRFMVALDYELNCVESTIINMFYCLENDNPKTISEISDLLNITKLKVESLKERAIHKLCYLETYLFVIRGIEIREQLNDSNEYLDSSINNIKLSVRTYNILRRNGINKLSDLYEKKITEIMKIKDMDFKGFDEILNILKTNVKWDEQA